MGPFTVSELVKAGLSVQEALMIVWPVSPEAFADFLAGKPVDPEARRVAREQYRADRLASKFKPGGVVR